MLLEGKYKRFPTLNSELSPYGDKYISYIKGGYKMKRNMLRITTAIGLVAAMTVSQSAPVLADDNSGDKITLTFALTRV